MTAPAAHGTTPRPDLRSRVRPLVPRRAWRLGHKVLNLRAALRHLPPAEVLALMGPGRGERPLELHPSNLLHPFRVPAEPAARRSFVDVVLRELYAAHRPAGSAPLILDGGAHVGDSGAWFLSRHPGARVVAVEPAAASHALLAENLAPYGERAFTVRAALWGEPGTVRLVDPGASTGVFATDAAGAPGEPVRALTPGELMDELGLPRLDLLKLDVEGAEASLFGSPSAEEWIGRVDAVLVELHDPTAGEAVLRILSRHGFSVRRHRELHVAVR